MMRHFFMLNMLGYLSEILPLRSLFWIETRKTILIKKNFNRYASPFKLGSFPT